MDAELLYEKLLNAGFRFVSYRPRSVKETTDFLSKKLVRYKTTDTKTLTRVLNRLRELNYLDDRAFAAWWVSQRQQFRPKGWFLILNELRKKGIERSILDGLQEQGGISDEEGATKALAKKRKLWERLPPLTYKKKAYDYLGRRGFDAETIGRVIDARGENEVK